MTKQTTTNAREEHERDVRRDGATPAEVRQAMAAWDGRRKEGLWNERGERP